jgi:hypothetical protein
MKKLVTIVFAVLMVMACSGSLTPEQQAAEAALSYYNRLLEGYPDGFMAGKADFDSLPSDYRRQLVGAAEQYVADMTAQHGGLASVAISENVGRTDTTLQLTYAFLMLSFRDSTQEEISVPMVLRDGEWLMK